MSSCHLLLGRPLDLFPLLGCHSVQCFVHLLSFILAISPAHLHFCSSVYSMSIISVLFLISEHVSYLVASDPTFFFPLLCERFSVCQLFIERPCLAAIGHCWQDTLVHFFLSETGSCLSWSISLFFPKQIHTALILA